MKYLRDVETDALLIDPELDSHSVYLSDESLKVVYFGKKPDTEFLCFEAIDETSTISLNNDDPGYAPVIFYSTDDKLTWKQWDFSAITLNAGKKVYMYGKNPDGISRSGSQGIFSVFVMTGKIKASGDIQSLISRHGSDTIPSEYCYLYLFQNCTSLISAPRLTATTLKMGCYSTMFENCTGLTTAPELPATTLAYGCYANMFKGCTSLTTAPALSATTLAESCYSSMFSGCTSLVTAPELPATDLSGCTSCYEYMFNGCTGLSSAPDLPATTVAQKCYYKMFYNCTALTTVMSELPATDLSGCTSCYEYMFQKCSNLVTAPKLPATTLSGGCYEYMFQACTKLVKAPDLPAKTLANQCYYYMFGNCSSLNYVKCYATDISSRQALFNWLYSVNSSGTLYYVEGVEYPSGASGLPKGWTGSVISE